MSSFKPIVSLHSVNRLRERAYPNITAGVAAAYLEQLAAEGAVVSSPRRWLKRANMRPGTRYVISSQDPDVCLVISRGVIVTVLVRDMYAGRRRRPQPAVRAEPANDGFNWRRDLRAEDLQQAVRDA